jgi:type IV secretion system protein VirB2
MMQNTKTHGSKKQKAMQTFIVAFMMSLGFITPAFAQLQKAQSTMNNVQVFLAGLSVTVVTIAIMFAGFKMIFQHSKWSEISNIVMGSMFIGGASGFAAWMLY